LNFRHGLKSASALALCAGLFFVQAMAPVAHDSLVAAQETAAHGFDLVPDPVPARDAWSRSRPAPEGHSHHDPSSCAVDRALAQGRLFLPVYPPSRLARPSASHGLPFRAPILSPRKAYLSGRFSRAPPAV
jgi:hypothetical protein